MNRVKFFMDAVRKRTCEFWTKLFFVR